MNFLDRARQHFVSTTTLEEFCAQVESYIFKQADILLADLEALYEQIDDEIKPCTFEEFKQRLVSVVDFTSSPEEIPDFLETDYRSMQHARLISIQMAITAIYAASFSTFISQHVEALRFIGLAHMEAGRAQSYNPKWIASLRGRANKAKADKRFEPMRQRAIAMWEQANPKTGRPWKSYSACARYCVQDGGIEQDQNTVAKWIGDFERKRKQKRRPVPPAKNPVN